MSVLKSKRKESKWEPIVFSIELHEMLIEMMQRNFGIKDVEHFVRVQYAYGKFKAEDIEYYASLLRNFKERIDRTAALLTNNVSAANAIYPTSMREYEMRRDYQNAAIVNCEQLIKELQRFLEIFCVDINSFERPIKEINREIGLIKKWRQRDNRIKSRLQGNL